MNAANDLLKSMLRAASANEVHRALTKQGYTVSLHRCEEMRGLMLACGEAIILTTPGGLFPHQVDPAADAAKGSDELLASITRLYERTARRRGCSVDAARLLLNYSPAQIQKMAA